MRIKLKEHFNDKNMILSDEKMEEYLKELGFKFKNKEDPYVFMRFDKKEDTAKNIESYITSVSIDRRDFYNVAVYKDEFYSEPLSEAS